MHLHRGLQLSNSEEQTVDTHNSLNGSQGNLAECEKSTSKVHTAWFLQYIALLKWQNCRDEGKISSWQRFGIKGRREVTVSIKGRHRGSVPWNKSVSWLWWRTCKSAHIKLHRATHTSACETRETWRSSVDGTRVFPGFALALWLNKVLTLEETGWKVCSPPLCNSLWVYNYFKINSSNKEDSKPLTEPVWASLLVLTWPRCPRDVPWGREVWPGCCPLFSLYLAAPQLCMKFQPPSPCNLSLGNRWWKHRAETQRNLGVTFNNARAHDGLRALKSRCLGSNPNLSLTVDMTSDKMLTLLCRCLFIYEVGVTIVPSLRCTMYSILCLYL